MTISTYEISTAGVVNGDLLIFLGSVDSINSNAWPNPIAPGFTQLDQTYFGQDLQTVVTAWKIANAEPPTYSAPYVGGPAGPMSAALSLIAISGADQAQPLRQTFSIAQTSQPAANASFSSPGVTTTVPNCLVLVAAMVDWQGTPPGTNTADWQPGFTELVHVGDRGDGSSDWSTVGVAYRVFPLAQATGVINATFPSTRTGMTWHGVVAVCP